MIETPGPLRPDPTFIPPNPLAAQAALNKALAAAIMSVRDVPKNGFNKHFGYAYTTAEDMLDVGRHALARQGLSLVPTSSSIRAAAVDEHFADPWKRDGSREQCGPRLAMSFLLVHEEGGAIPVGPCEWPIIVEKGRDEQKAAGAAHTNLLSYTIRDLLQIPRVMPGDNQDDDAPPQGDVQVDQDAQLRAALLNATPALTSDERKALFKSNAGVLSSKRRNTLGAWLHALASWADGTNPMTSESPLSDRETELVSEAGHIVRNANGTVPWDEQPPAAARHPLLPRLEALLAAKTPKAVEELETDVAGLDELETATVQAYAMARYNILGGKEAESEMEQAELEAYHVALSILAGEVTA